LSQSGISVKEWESLETGTQSTRYGANEADRFLEDVRARSDILRQNPGSERALRDALRGVRQTYDVLINAIDQFLSPLIAKSSIELGQYMDIASGRMVAEIEKRRGHCKRITQIYIESGGLRESLPESVNNQAKEALDALMLDMAGADNDLFQQMTSVGSTLANEAAVITNFILANQHQLAEAHLRKCASKLLPLQQDLAQGIGRVDSLITDLGIDI